MSSTPEKSQWTTKRVGIALLVIATGLFVQIFGGTDPVKPSGYAAEVLERSIARLVEKSGGAIRHSDCTMIGNVSLTVTCAATGTTIQGLKSVLDEEGWERLSDPPFPSAESYGWFATTGVVISISVDAHGHVTKVSAQAAKNRT